MLDAIPFFGMENGKWTIAKNIYRILWMSSVAMVDDLGMPYVGSPRAHFGKSVNCGVMLLGLEGYDQV